MKLALSWFITDDGQRSSVIGHPNKIYAQKLSKIRVAEYHQKQMV
jgi:hypothetical protein